MGPAHPTTGRVVASVAITAVSAAIGLRRARQREPKRAFVRRRPHRFARGRRRAAASRARPAPHVRRLGATRTPTYRPKGHGRERCRAGSSGKESRSSRASRRPGARGTRSADGGSTACGETTPTAGRRRSALCGQVFWSSPWRAFCPPASSRSSTSRPRRSTTTPRRWRWPWPSWVFSGSPPSCGCCSTCGRRFSRSGRDRRSQDPQIGSRRATETGRSPPDRVLGGRHHGHYDDRHPHRTRSSLPNRHATFR